VINSLWPWVVESSATCTKMKAAKKGKKLIPTQKRRTGNPIAKRKTFQNTIKIEKDKIAEISAGTLRGGAKGID
jgi:hypothetical protein